MSRSNLFYTVAFDPPGRRDRLDQALLLKESICRVNGWWSPDFVIFHNGQVGDIPEYGFRRVRHENFDRDRPTDPRNGKLPSCRFRFRASEHLVHDNMLFREWGPPPWVIYLDTDMVCRRPLGPLFRWLDEECDGIDMVWTPVRGRNRADSRWFGGHFTERSEIDAARKAPAVQGGSTFFRGSTWRDVCLAWDVIDRLQVRTRGFAPTDQSSQNRFVHLCETGKLPWRTKALPDTAVLSPRSEQMRRHRRHSGLDAYFFHYWGFGGEQERLALARAELHQRMTTQHHPLLGTWRHRKPCEGIENLWTFHENGRVEVAPGTLTGTWTVYPEVVLVQWGFGGVEVIPQSEIDGHCSGCAVIAGHSYKGGNHSFTLTRDAGEIVPAGESTPAEDDGDNEGGEDPRA